MTLRYLAVVVLLSAVGAGLLGLRQQQLNDKHAMAESHARMKEAREHIKDLQVRIAKMTRPEALNEAIERADITVEPISRRPTAQQDNEEAEGSDG
jgi:crotonobetainyl-CoA:carnitine CoA-transferase CaiB-like acyl-CoA transferase